MNARAQTADAQRLARIRASLAEIAPGEWRRVQDGPDALVMARGDFGEPTTLLRFEHASLAEIEFVADAVETVRFLLGLVDRAIERMRALPADPPASESARQPDGEPEPSAAKNFAAECAMLCVRPVFKAFLEDKHGLERPLTDDRVTAKVRAMLGVPSRADLNIDEKAAARWRALRGEFQAWKRTGR